MKKGKDKFPLRKHASGNWTKVIQSKQVYFGKDRDEALKKYHDYLDKLERGQNPAAPIRLNQLCNQYLRHLQARVRTGTLTEYSWNTNYRACEKVIDRFGRRTPVIKIRPHDWTAFHSHLCTTLSPATVTLTVGQIKAMLRWAYRNELIREPVRLGEFKAMEKRLVKRSRNPRRRDLKQAEVIELLRDTDGDLRAWLLLMLNCAFIQQDLVDLQPTHIEGEFLTMRRRKTEEERRSWLWRPTRLAIADRLPFEIKKASISYYLEKHFKERGIDAAVISLRHTCLTQCAMTGDEQTTRWIAGHSGQSMLSNYLHGMDDDRIQNVCQAVYRYVFPPPPEVRRADYA